MTKLTQHQGKMYLDELVLQRELQEQKYLSQTLIRCKQFRLGIYHAFGQEKFFEKDDEVQKILDAIELSDFMKKEKMANTSLDYNRFFPDGEIKAFGMTPELMSTSEVRNTSLEQLLKFEMEVLEKLNEKRKKLLKKLERLHPVSGQADAADTKDKPLRKWTASAIKKILLKYNDYQDKHLILQTLIVEKLLKRAEKITEYQRSLLTDKIDQQLELVCNLTGTRHSKAEANGEQDIKPKKNSVRKWPFGWLRKDTEKREVTSEDRDRKSSDELVTWLLSGNPKEGQRLTLNDVYTTVVKDYTPTMPGYLSLKVGQTVKQKTAGSEEGVCFGWTRPGRFSRKRYGFFPAECVVPRD